MGLTLKTVFESAGLDLEQTAVVLHTTRLQPLRDLLPSMVAERPDLFAAYQMLHSDRAAATLANRRFIASFVPLSAGQMLFAGVWRILACPELPVGDIYLDKRLSELATAYGASDTDPAVNIPRGGVQRRFDLELTDIMAKLRGRLRIETPAGRTYVRLAERFHQEIDEITRDPIWSAPMPNWQDVHIPATSLNALPQVWVQQLAQWRGIYLIVDQSDGARYVGSAYGADNLIGRWRTHCAGEKGVTAELRHRDPQNFEFSILELVAPSLTVDQIVPIENSWKKRLQTIRWGLNQS